MSRFRSRVVTAMLGASVFLVSFPSMAQQKRAGQFDTLKQVADLCGETKRCGGLIENVKIDIGGNKIDAIKVTTPQETKTFFKRNLVEVCYCTDCVSVPPQVWCDIIY